MGWRFQRRVKLLPGVTLNLSRRGISTSLGVRGARVTLGHGQRRTTVGLPGTGVSHTRITRTRPKVRTAAPPWRRGTRWVLVLVAIVVTLALAFAVA